MNSETGTAGGAQDAQSEEAKRKAEATRQKAISESQEGGKVIAEEAKAVGQKAGELGREHAERRFEQGKETIEGQVDAVGDALGDAAERLRAENNPLASYAEELSGQLSQLSQGIENSTLDDVAVKTRKIARENPGLFVLGSMVAGLAAARFFKASAERERRESYTDDAYDFDDDFRGRSAQGGRDPYRDDYRGQGYGTVGAGRGEAEYRSPVAATSEPPRSTAVGGASASPATPAVTTGGGTGAASDASGDTSSTSATAAPSVSRVPMDSGVSNDTTNPKTKSGA